MADNGRGQDPGEDVALAFDMGFDDNTGHRPERTFGADPNERGSRRPAAAPPPPDMDDEFEAMPEPGQEFGAPVSASHDDFDDLGGGGAAAGGHTNSDFDDDHAQAFGQAGDPVEDFDTPHEDEHSDGHFGAEASDDLDDQASQDHTHHEEDDEAALRTDHDDEEAEVAPEAAGRSLMSRALVPAIALGSIAAVGWLGWSYVSPLFFDQAPVQQAQVQQPRIQMQPPSATPPGKLPPLPSGGQARPPVGQQTPQPAPQQQAAVQPGLAPLQPAQQPLPQRPLQQATPAPSAQPVAQQPQTQPAAVASPAPQQAATVQPQPAPQVPTGMNRPSDDAMVKIFGAIAEVSNDVKGLGVRIDGIEKSAKDTRADLSRRMDDIDARTKAGGVHVASADPTATIAPKASAVQPPPSAPALSKKVTRPTPVAEDDTPRRAERSVKHGRRAKLERRQSVDSDSEDRAYAGDEPPAKPRVIGDYHLKGVSTVGGRSSALIKSKRGLEEVSVGQTLPGGGEVRSIRMSGNSWVVVTSRGVIVE